MCLNQHELRIIQSKAVRQFIRVMGYEACFPRGIVFAPKLFGGLGIQQLYANCYCNKIETLITNIN